jgi:hypothetical protein
MAGGSVDGTAQLASLASPTPVCVRPLDPLAPVAASEERGTRLGRRHFTVSGSLALMWSTVSSSTNQISYAPGFAGAVRVPGLPSAVL